MDEQQFADQFKNLDMFSNQQQTIYTSTWKFLATPTKIVQNH